MLTFIRSLGGRKAEYRCVCGVVKALDKYNVAAGRTKSCGCQKSKMCAAVHRTHGHKSGGKQSRAHRAWSHMKSRCLNKNAKNYPYYGGRGITICDRWKDSFEVFLADMGEPPPGAQLDRIDNNGNYEPGNCRWADRTEQANNKRNNARYTAFGKTQTLPQWSRELGIDRLTLYMRIKRGATPEEAFSRPLRPQ